MLMVTTSNEHCNAVWVKNEWSRYIGFMKENHNKVLIPVCKDINPYELPPELTKFQAQDMDKVGAMQDLIFAVKQLISVEAKEKKDIVLETLVKEKIEQEEKKRERRVKVEQSKSVLKKILFCLGSVCVCVLLAFWGVKLYKNVIIPNSQFKQAEKYMEEAMYDKALNIFASLNDYKDSENKIIECEYYKSVEEYDKGNFDLACEMFLKNIDYTDSMNYISKCIKNIQIELISEKSSAEYDERFRKYQDKMNAEDIYEIAKKYYDCDVYSRASYLFGKILEFENANELYAESLYQMSVSHYQFGEYKEALSLLNKASQVENKKVTELLQEWKNDFYERGEEELTLTNWGSAKEYFDLLIEPEYKDSSSKVKLCQDNINIEKNTYLGDWVEEGESRKSIVITETDISYRNGFNNIWRDVSYLYDEDTAEMKFVGSLGECYQIYVQGNCLKIVQMDYKDTIKGELNGRKYYRE